VRDARPDPGTLNDLIIDAAAVNLSFNEPLARKWHRLGLLGSPTRQPLGRGQGSDPAIYSSEQRALFRAIARDRAGGNSLKTVAAWPVWVWLHFDGWVELLQLRRALATAVGNPKLSGRVARRSAQHVLGVVDRKFGRPGDRGRLREELVQQLEKGWIDENELLPKVRAVLEPPSITDERDAGAAWLSAERVTSILHLRMLAQLQLRRVTDAQLLTARQQHLAALSEDIPRREALAQQAVSLGREFAEKVLQDDVLSSVPNLLYLVGLQLHHEQNAARRERR
jgi:hypothetical protein